jgi:hypothetical protein
MNALATTQVVAFLFCLIEYIWHMAAPHYPENNQTGAFWPVKGCIPTQEAVTAFVFSNNGTDTLGVIEAASNPGVDNIDPADWHIRPDMWVYDGDNIRRITLARGPAYPIKSATVKLDLPFPVALVRVPLVITRRGFQSLSILNIGAANGTINNNMTLPPGISVSPNQEALTKRGKQSAVCYDATGTTFIISLQNS